MYASNAEWSVSRGVIRNGPAGNGLPLSHVEIVQVIGSWMIFRGQPDELGCGFSRKDRPRGWQLLKKAIVILMWMG